MSPMTALRRVLVGDKDPRLIRVIASNGQTSVMYAVTGLKGRFVEGEPIIARSSRLSHSYYVAVIKEFAIEITTPILAEIKKKHDWWEHMISQRFWEEHKR